MRTVLHVSRATTAATNPFELAYCCKSGTSVEECGLLFDDVLSKTKHPAATTSPASATVAFTPTATAGSIVARPHRTALPNSGVTGDTKNNGTSSEQGLSTGAKVGISIGAVAGIGLIAAALAFLIVHLRHKKKYNAVGGHGEAGMGGHFGPISAPVPIQSGNAFEPMQQAFEYQQSLNASPHPPATTAYYQGHPGARSFLHNLQSCRHFATTFQYLHDPFLRSCQ
ncbi:hypothetical protein BDV96DRAFT_235675 [Lophiotrema nucula]|uniref:Mid2 domain-containing protein n=1 Tax=Lophiotrema nucula TaxID=690887 RepID=A0A6A5YTJ9_9PLEO|nr:hypothetical protein BDV96DRAFT_235675 [Lophiotrema nucula]